MGATYTSSEPSFVNNHTHRHEAAQQYLLQKVDDPALGLLVPFGGTILLTSVQTGMPCGLHPRPYEQSPTGSALALYCNATGTGKEFVYMVIASLLPGCAALCVAGNPAGVWSS
jgi:hypothetical protein